MQINKLSFLSNRLEESKILLIYRYISLIITSAFYFLNHPEHELGRKIFIIGCLSIAAIILSYLYLIFENSHKNIMILLFIETIGNAIILMPSGGIKSPFIWYSLNTILISSIFLKKRYCWINLILYFLSFYIITNITSGISLDILGVIRNESNLFLSFIMIIAAIQALSVFINKTKDRSYKLEIVNSQLESANQMIIESTNHIKALYQSVNILSNQGNKEGLIKLLFDHIKNITKTNTIFYYDIENNMIYDGSENLRKQLEDCISKNIKYILEFKTPKELIIQNKRFVIIIIETNYTDYGILGFESTDIKESVIYKNNINQIQFLSELISISLERFYLEEINERLLVTEEQNRIANEIHDSVLQRLFSMSCGVFSLMKKLDKLSTDEIKDELNHFREATDLAMKELRAKIYGLSWKKTGYNSFSKDIKKYIEDIRKFNNVNIPFSIQGNDELLSCNQKKALYRMICEGVGNAVRHGKAKTIEVSLIIRPEESQLKILDNGIGFDVDRVNMDNTKGLGLLNLQQLTKSMQGQITINSKLGSYTRIEAVIPNNMVLVKGEESMV